MLNPSQVVETYFLESRHQLLEIAAYLDRYDAAVARAGDRNGQAEADEKKLAVIRQALAIVSEKKPSQERTVALLELFATL
jgi:cobalamin-dependent methionine synthase I